MKRFEKDEEGRVSLNTDQILASPDMSGIQFVTDKEGLSTFKTQADADAHAAAVKERNAISHFFLNDGDTFALVLRVNGKDFQTVGGGTIEAAGGLQARLYVRAQLVRDVVAPAEPEPVEVV